MIKVNLKYTIVFALLFSTAASAYPKTTGQYKKEIESSSKNLQDLQKSLKEKRIEKEQCLLDEKCIRAELYKIDKELLALQKKGDLLKKEIRSSEKKLAESEKELKIAGWEKRQWEKALFCELNKWYRANHVHFLIQKDVVEERLRYDAMVQKRSYIGNAVNKETVSKQAIFKWQSEKTKLQGLKQQQEKTLQDQAKAKDQKKTILNSTIGRRIAAENEINRLTETAKALEQLIIKLEKERKKTETEAMERKKFKEKKKRLPWPVEGSIVVRFGRNKHPELDTFIISNGIKIKAASNCAVKAVSKGDVLFSGEFRSYGQMVILDHGGGFYTIYGQLSEVAVKEGQKIPDNGILGKIGNGVDPVLYFEVRSENNVEDPELWLK